LSIISAIGAEIRGVQGVQEFRAAAGTNGADFSSKNGPRKKIEALTAV
jgi:hypothetical protein